MRTTQKDLQAVVDRIREETGDDSYEIETAYGRPRLVRDGGARDISPRLPMGQMLTWLEAFEAGIAAGFDAGFDHANKSH